MGYRRAVVILVLLALSGIANRVPGQAPTRTPPTVRKIDQVAQPEAEPGDLIPDTLPTEEPDDRIGPDAVPGPVLQGPPPQLGRVPGAPVGVAPGLPFIGPEECVPLDPPSPQVRIRVRVPAMATAGQELTYRLIVENQGQGAAHQTRVRASLPNGVRLVRAEPQPTTTQPEPIWQLGTIRGCGRREITLVVVPTGESDVRICARVQHEYGQCVTTQVSGKPPRVDDRVIPGPPVRPTPPEPGPGPRPLPQPPMPQPQPQPPMPQPQPQPAGRPEVGVKITLPPTGPLYEIISAQVEVRNTGTGPSRDTQLALSLAPGLSLSGARPAETSNNPLSWSLGEILPGQSKKIDLDLVLKENGLLVIDAEAKATGIDRRTDRAQIRVSEIKLDVAVRGPTNRVAPSTAQYVIQVTNTGDMVARNVVVTNSIPELIEYVRSDSGGKFDKREVRWDLGTLQPGERREVRLEIGCRARGLLRNRAMAQAAGMAKGITGEAVTSFEDPVGGVTIEIDRTDPLLEVGKTGLYTIRVINQGEGPVEEVAVKVTFPMELTPLEPRVRTEPRVPVNRDGQVILLGPLAQLPGKQALQLQIPASASAVGEVRIKVEVAAKQLTAPIRADEGTTIYK